VTDQTLSGKVAVVTGGSRGIGFATCELLASKGAHVIASARAEANGDALRERVKELPGSVTVYPLDLADPASVDSFVEAIEANVDRVDYLVNNAGVLPQAQRLADVTREERETTVAVNLVGPWELSCRLKPRMPRGGVIVNLASTAAYFPSVGLGTYCVSKAAVVMLTRVCALEWARDGIRVVAVAPGKTDTDMVVPVVEYVTKRGERLNPLDRLGSPEEVAGLICFLLGDEASQITGVTIPIDGGETITSPR
jgi:NAD(P)-dependent dehydrogenase (short-subunit alcohol dehydrogenase family)